MKVGRASRERPQSTDTDNASAGVQHGDEEGTAARVERGEEPASLAPSAGGLTRVTVNLNRQAVQALEAVSGATGYSKTDTINRALQVYAIVQEIMERSGGTLQVKLSDGAIERIHIV